MGIVWNRRSAFTLLELMIVIVIMAILSVMMIPMYGNIKERAERTGCLNNLRSLHFAGDAYIQEHKSWPQISLAGPNDRNYPKQWKQAFEPYGINSKQWICPSVQRLMGDPNYEQDIRIDYFGTPFPPGPDIPYRWAKQPWFIERGNLHGDGNLVVFSSGVVSSLNEILPKK